MGRCILKIPYQGEDYYLEWSSTVDAPITVGMRLDEFKEYYEEEYGRVGLPGLDARLARANATGSSGLVLMPKSLEHAALINRAGPEEARLSLEGLIQGYVVLADLLIEDPVSWNDKMEPYIVADED